VAVMREGVIQQVGTPEEIRNHPANDFVADFVKYYDYIYKLRVSKEAKSKNFTSD